MENKPTALELMLQKLELAEGKHYQLRDMQTPVLDAHYYTSLGKRLFELYQKHQVPSDEQREMEALVFFLSTFSVHRGHPQKKSRWKRFLSLFGL